MSISSRHIVSSTPQSAKRKHFDEEAQFYADEDESWKKQRTDHDYYYDESSPTCSTGSWSTTTNADVTMDRCGEDYGINPSELPQETIGKQSYDSKNTNTIDMDVEGDDDSTTTMPTYTTTAFVTKDATSWSMINSKELRRQSPEKSLVARRDIMKLWRLSSSNSTAGSPLPNS